MSLGLVTLHSIETRSTTSAACDYKCLAKISQFKSLIIIKFIIILFNMTLILCKKKDGKSQLRLQHSCCKGNMDVDLGTKML